MQRKAKQVSDEDWERHKDEIIGLYHSRSLKDIVQTMQEKYGFEATTRQYTYRLAVWSIKKNGKSKEMGAAIKALLDQKADDNSIPTEKLVRWATKNSSWRKEAEMDFLQDEPSPDSTISESTPCEFGSPGYDPLGDTWIDRYYFHESKSSEDCTVQLSEPDIAGWHQPALSMPSHHNPEHLPSRTQKRPYTCPYLARSKKFASYDTCCEWYRDVGSIVRHITRDHKRIPCPQCSSAPGHNRDASCQCRKDYDPEDGITEEQGDAIAGLSVSGTWRNLYALLFPMDNKIPSPYVESHDAQNQIATRLLYEIQLLDVSSQYDIMKKIEGAIKSQRNGHTYPVKSEFGSFDQMEKVWDFPVSQWVPSCDFSNAVNSDSEPIEFNVDYLTEKHNDDHMFDLSFSTPMDV